MSLIDLTNFSPALKKLVPYITRANEVSKRNPNVAYFCLTYALEIGVKLSKNLRSDRGAMNSLVGLMDQVEKLKSTLNPNIEEGRALMELYSLKIFKVADDKEHSGDITKSTMLLYLMSSYLMETTRQFEGGISVDIYNKQKYARWRAVEIRKHLKGEEMEPAPPRGTEKNNDSDLLVDNSHQQPSQQPQQPDEELDPLEAIRRSLRAEENKTKRMINYNNPPMNMSLGYENSQKPPTTSSEDDNLLPLWMREEQKQKQQQKTQNTNLPSSSSSNQPKKSSLPPYPQQYTNTSQVNSIQNSTSQEPKRNSTTTTTSSNDEDILLPFWMRENQQQPKNESSNLYPSSSSSSTITNSIREIPKPKPKPRTPTQQPKPKPRIPTQPKPKPKPKPKPTEQIIRPKVVHPKKRSISLYNRSDNNNNNINGKSIPMKNVIEAQKLAKYAASSCQFNDVKAARKYLIDALNLLGGI